MTTDTRPGDAAPSVSLTTLGCRVNQAETETIAREFARLGFRLVPFGERADVAVVNTCTVTHEADRQARQLARRARRSSPDGMVVVTGCYASVAAGEAAALPEVDVVVGNREKDGLARQVAALLRERGRDTGVRQPEAAEVPGWFGRTRAQLKVEEGCNNRCTFCIVPAARGSQRSMAPAQVVETIRRLELLGYREVVLTGTHLGGYGRDLVPRRGLADLLEAVLRDTSVSRVRLSSVEPQDFPLQALPLWRDRRLCRHFHLPVQSGSDAVLRRMLRGYRSERFARLRDAIHEAVPDAAITTDAIVGFPGETDEQFEETRALLERCGVARVHVFPYSPRAGTPAADMPDQVPASVKRERVAALTAASHAWHEAFRSRFIGSVVDVLFEHDVAPGVWEGLTDNYVRVRCDERSTLFNLIRPVEIEALEGDGVRGRIAHVPVRPIRLGRR